MGNIIYPPPAATYAGDIESIHRLLQRPQLVAKRVQQLLQQRYIADAILKGRFQAIGGAITYENGEPLGSLEDPRAIAPGGEYPIVDIGSGVISTAKTVKWGQDAVIYDESIARLTIKPVNRALSAVANRNVIFVDGVAMAVVGTAITQATDAAATWVNPATSAAQILSEALTAQAQIRKLDLGYEADTVVVDDLVYAAVFAKFVAAGYLPREANNAIQTNQFPDVGGMKWLPTNHGIPTTALVVDSENLGGMADEDLHSPGYVKASDPGTTSVEVKTIRDEDIDGYRVRGRRVTVPVVTDSGAGWKIRGVA